MIVSRPDVSHTELTDFPVVDRFLKLPIKNVLEHYNIEPIDPQIALINAINDPKYRFVVAALSRRTGKTFISNLILHSVLLVPGTTCLIMAPNYSLAQISWEAQMKMVKDNGLEVERANTKDRVLELKNGSMLRVGSVTQADSVVGRSYDLILFDECALSDDGQSAFNIQLRPTLDKPNSKAIFISTPRGVNWFKDFYDRGFSSDPKWKRWVSIMSTVEDNPRADPEDVEDARQGMSAAEFEQEYYCNFTVQQGLIWKFNRANIVDINYSPELETIAGLDIGFRDATAFVVVQTDGTNYYIIDEYLESGRATREHALIIREMMDKYNIDFIYIDHAAAQTRADLAYDYDISCVSANKSVLDGIGYVASIVEWDRLYVDVNCVNTIATLMNYRWDLRPGKIREEPVHDEFSHIADALRYALYSYSPNMDALVGV